MSVDVPTATPAPWKRIPPLVWVVLAGVVLFTPSLAVTYFADDWFHLAYMEGTELLAPRARLDLFSFVVAGDPALSTTQGLATPWWTSEGFRASFWRPLTSATHQLDHVLWGRNPVGAHASSLLWWAALITVVGLFYRELARDFSRSRGLVVFGTLLYVLDDAHCWNIAWLANRNALVSVVFSVLSLLLYHRFRTSGRFQSLALCLVFYLLGLMGGETAISVVLWVVAYECTLGTGVLRQRLAAAAPVGVATLLYLVLWSQAGFGTAGSGLYISPFERPFQFAWVAVTQRMPLLLAASVGPLAADLSFFFAGDMHPLLLALAWMVVLVVGAGCASLLRRDPVCRFMALGAVLSLLPVSSTFASNRLLLFPTIGTAWVVACFIGEVRVRRREGGAGSVASPGRRLQSALAAALVLVHGVLAPIGAVFGVVLFIVLGRQMTAFSQEAEVPGGEAADRAQVLLLNAPDPFTPTYLPLIRWLHGHPFPQAMWQLSLVPGDQVLHRTSATGFTLEAAPPGFLVEGWDRLFRESPEVALGEEFRRGEMKVTADQVTEGRLERIAVQLERSLDDPDLHLLAWNGERWARMAAPEVGACALVPLANYEVQMSPYVRERLVDACPATIEAYATSPRASPRASTKPSTRPSPTPSPSPSPSPSTSTCSLEISTVGSFETRAEFPCPAEGPLRIVALGDVGRPGRILDDTVSAAKALCREQPCHLMTLAGDLIYGPGGDAEGTWQAVWDQSLATLELPTLASLGNHEYRHEPQPELKRKALYAADGRHGLVLPSASYAARIRRGDATLLAVAALDTDSVANPGPEMPGLGVEALALACAQGAPTLTVGHHPPTSQGRHHGHEAHVEQAIQAVLVDARNSGCNLVAALAGHDHDMQAYQPSCETEGLPGVVVSGAAAKGYRPPGPQHLASCKVEGPESRYHAGPRDTGGVAIVTVQPETSEVEVVLYDTRGAGQSVELSRLSW